jgi:hypothetical protein
MKSRIGIPAHICRKKDIVQQFPFPAHPHMLRRAAPRYLGHKNTQGAARYTELSPQWFKSFWADRSEEGCRAMVWQNGRWPAET